MLEGCLQSIAEVTTSVCSLCMYGADIEEPPIVVAMPVKRRMRRKRRSKDDAYMKQPCAIQPSSTTPDCAYPQAEASSSGPEMVTAQPAMAVADPSLCTSTPVQAMPTEPTDENQLFLKSFASVMSEGIRYTMLYPNGVKRERLLVVDATSVSWTRVRGDSSAPTSIPLTDILSIDSIADSRVCDAHPDVDPDLLFTISSRNRGHATFCAMSPVEREILVEGLSMLIRILQ